MKIYLKGKAHKKYEFGNKVGLVLDGKSKVVLAVESYTGNPHDSNRMKQKLPQEIIYDRGGRGAKEIEGVKILTPSKSSTEYQRRSLRKKFRARAGIEPVIGHLK